jgi:hypothetical protein
METSSLESVPEIIEFYGCHSGGWPNISGAKLTGTIDRPYGDKKYRYTFNNLWNNKASFRLELIGLEFKFLESFKIIKITTKK